MKATIVQCGALVLVQETGVEHQPHHGPFRHLAYVSFKHIQHLNFKHIRCCCDISALLFDSPELVSTHRPPQSLCRLC